MAATSLDGITWDNKGPVWFGENLDALAWAGTSFVAVGTFDGYQAISFTSADAASPWSGPAIAEGASAFHSVAWNGSVVVAAGHEWVDITRPESRVAILATSTDLVSWTVLPVPSPFSFVTSIIAVGSSFLAVGADATSRCVFATSSDGQNWDAHPISNGTGCFAMATSGSEFVVLGRSSSGVIAAFVSSDGITWEGPFDMPPILYGAITWSGSQYFSVGGAVISRETISATSPDGRTWTGPVSVPLYLGGFPGSLVSFVVPPRVDATSPVSGLTPGGVPVRIAGDFFQTGATVTFGGTLARRADVVSATTLWAVPPAHDPGAVDVTVTNPDGQTATLQSAYVYSTPRPTR